MNRHATIKCTIIVKDPNDNKSDSRIASCSAVFGPKGIKAIDVLKNFDNIIRNKYSPGTPLIVKVYVDLDHNGRSLSYTMNIGKPSTTYLVKSMLNCEKFSEKPGQKSINCVDINFVKKIAEIKHDKIVGFEEKFEDSNGNSINSIIGTLKSMGIVVER